MTSPAPAYSVAVVGAGLAGLACARSLVAAGAGVTMFDKGRRPGGRIATRRSDGLVFNHGAQFATARGPGWQAVIATLGQAGVMAEWPAAAATDGQPARWAGVPAMSAIPAHLAAGVIATGGRIHADRHVLFLHAAPDGWLVRHAAAAGQAPGAVGDRGGDLAGPFDAVALALPAAQAAPLLAAAGHRWAADLAAVTIAPCWAGMLAFPTRIDAPDTARPGSGPLAWIARESSRPGPQPGAAGPDAWTVHAAPDWTRANLERPAGGVAPDLLAAFAALTGATGQPVHLAAHRWRYALVEAPLGTPCLWDPSARLGLCGDGCIGPRLEAAWDSGRALARAILPGP